MQFTKYNQPTKLKIKQVTITPEEALDLLSLNTDNRPVSEAHVKNLAAEMSSGRWRQNGDTICRSTTKLVDGQHRLYAVIESGVTIQAVIAYVEDDVFPTIDVGKRRSGADTLALVGEQYTATLASALMLIDTYKTGKMGSRVRYPNSVLPELLERHPGARVSVRTCHSTRGIIAPAVLTACHYLFGEKDLEAADRFAQDLVAGAGLLAADPVFILRERLIREKTRKVSLQRSYIVALTIKAWNARRQGAKISRLVWQSDGPKAEVFPVVV